MNFQQPIPTLRPDGDGVVILDQTCLPHHVRTLRLTRVSEIAHAITHMQVRGAPLIGAAAAFGVALAMRQKTDHAFLAATIEQLADTRPTAVNLHWALTRMRARLAPLPAADRARAAWLEAEAILQEDAETCAAIGDHGLSLLQQVAEQRDGAVRVMTHCNAGWVATLGAGTALAPVYAARQHGIHVHVWVSETRPRNQGLLTAWELREAGVAHTLTVDDAAGILLARGEVDMVITGADRVAANGDTANKVGTYLKALAARDNGVPFYIAAPLSTVDFNCADGHAVPVEDRGPDEVRNIAGLNERGDIARVQLAPDGSPAGNLAFDITPARLIDGIITEHGIVAPDRLHTLRDKAAR